MKVAFHLRRRPDPEPASAVLLESDDVDAVLELASRLGTEHASPIYRVSGGFLLMLEGGCHPQVGPIRLRRLAENLYLPVDADLVPALLDDEARGLTRDLGLVFLPGGRVLGFDPASPLPASMLVQAERSAGLDWRSFPERPDRARRIREIELESPEMEREGLFDSGADTAGIGSDGPPRPDEAGAASTLAGRAAVGAGKGLIGLGAVLGIKALADLGAKWIGRAVERVPRLTEAMLGRQEGALRELLRQFREGDVNQALRHALPLGGQGSRGGLPSGDGKLPNNDPTYSLQSLLGSGRGPSGIWFGGFDVQAELAREYRKAADEAERRGDYRRAAYIHGKLLNDYLNAAHLLAQGGLHHDAAVVYLNRVKDLAAAARSFEAAGDADRALRLYRRVAMHGEAGDLLRRVGEEEEAIQEYLVAADLLAKGSRQGRLAAGDLLRDRARRPDLAMDYYAQGWRDRPSSHGVACGLRMATSFAERAEVSPLFKLLDEADTIFLRPGLDNQAGEFYNAVAELADRDGLAGVRDDFRDRALMGLAAKLRQSVATPGRPGQVASAFLGRSRLWPAEVIGDATHALKAAAELESERRRVARQVVGPRAIGEPRRIEVGGGVVSAACHASTTGEVFLGFETGEVYRVDVARGEVARLDNDHLPVSSLSVDPEGQTLVILLGEGAGGMRLVHRTRVPASTGWTRQVRAIDGPGDFWMTPVLAIGRSQYLGVWNGEELILMGGVGALTNFPRLPMPFLKTEPHAALLIPPTAVDPMRGTILIHDGPDVCHVDYQGRMLRRRYLGWRPTLLEGLTLRSVPLAWLPIDPGRIELAGLDREGVARWSSLTINEAELIRTATNLSTGETSYAATTLVRAGLVAGVRASGIDWLRCGHQSFTAIGSTGPAFPEPIACFPSHRTGELVVVCGDGTLVCVTTPR